MFILLCLIINVSCVFKNKTQRAYVIEDDKLELINVGLTNKENTIQILGYPALRSYFNDNIWYYYSYTTKEFLFFKPTISDQKILILEFDPETNVVLSKKLKNIDSDKQNITDINKEYEIEQESVINDILNNIGQVSPM